MEVVQQMPWQILFSNQAYNIFRGKWNYLKMWLCEEHMRPSSLPLFLVLESSRSYQNTLFSNEFRYRCILKGNLIHRVGRHFCIHLCIFLSTLFQVCKRPKNDWLDIEAVCLWSDSFFQQKDGGKLAMIVLKQD